jgi:succinate-semialdehyde dehydrogenase/glutarate-semialdehyde dehydrogenase
VNAAAVKKVQEHVSDALSKGGKLHTGGSPPTDEELKNGFFFTPTVITGCTKDMLVASEETFGPLAAIFSFSSESEAIELANATEVGLAGYFFSRDVGRVFRVARALEVGMVGVNTGLISAAESPFGGVKESGVGREGAALGLSEYENVKTVTVGGLGL